VQERNASERLYVRSLTSVSQVSGESLWLESKEDLNKKGEKKGNEKKGAEMKLLTKRKRGVISARPRRLKEEWGRYERRPRDAAVKQKKKKKKKKKRKRRKKKKKKKQESRCRSQLDIKQKRVLSEAE